MRKLLAYANLGLGTVNTILFINDGKILSLILGVSGLYIGFNLLGQLAKEEKDN